jgi:chromosome partitioning protein
MAPDAPAERLAWATVAVVSVISLKGGVGKTTVALGLAGAAQQRRLAVLLVDLDPQANATTALGIDAGEVALPEVLDEPRRAVVAEAIVASSWGAAGNGHVGRVDVLAGSDRADRLDEPNPRTVSLRRLSMALRKIEDTYDLVLLDCPPTLRRLTRTGLDASDRALIVGEPGLFAVQGADRALRAVHEERAHNPALRPLGVVVNRFRDRNPEHRYRLDELRRLFGPLILAPPVPERSALQQAQGASMPIQRWGTEGGREAAEAFDRLLDRVLRASRRRPTG